MSVRVKVYRSAVLDVILDEKIRALSNSEAEFQVLSAVKSWVDRIDPATISKKSKQKTILVNFKTKVVAVYYKESNCVSVYAKGGISRWHDLDDSIDRHIRETMELELLLS